jgi:hypothetical protein
VLPHHPLAEQQSPNELPKQVRPFAPLHEASVETFLVEIAVGPVEVLVEVRIVKVVIARFVVGSELLPVHNPNDD